MRIAILTFHRATNYGAVLQCYALQECLRSLGANVEVVNYRQPYIDNICKALHWRTISSAILHVHPRVLWNSISPIPHRWLSKMNFNKFRKRYLNMTVECDECNIPKYFDAFIVGSDQVWGIHHTNGIDNVYWGNFNHGKAKLFSYAASSDICSLDTIGNEQLTALLQKFTTISCREKSIAKRIEIITGRQTRIDIDPVLLMGAEFWTPILNKKWKNNRYIVIHEARWLKGNENELRQKASILAQKENCKIISLSNLAHSPIDFISAIKYARCIITSSFHAMAFALIFNRPLIAIKLNDGHDGRYVDLLSAIEAQKALVDIHDSEYNIIELNYKSINDKMSDYRNKSLEYLRQINENRL